jgi:hypothetical protein
MVRCSIMFHDAEEVLLDDEARRAGSDGDERMTTGVIDCGVRTAQAEGMMMMH